MEIKRTMAGRRLDRWVIAGAGGLALLALAVLVLTGPVAASGVLFGAAGAAVGRLQVARSESIPGTSIGLALMLLGASVLLGGLGAEPARAFGLATGLAIVQGAALFGGSARRAD